ncbi:MAG: hypothetical protein ABI910_17360 [Gemmatimonadota bacterium]
MQRADIWQGDPALGTAHSRRLHLNRGPEMADHARLTTETQVPVFFRDPKSP